MTDRNRPFDGSRRALCAALAAAPFAPARAALGDKPIVIVAPYPPGGAADTLSRIVARHLATRLGRPVIVENKAGAGTAIGAGAVAQAAPDGHTLLLSSNTTFTMLPALRQKLPFDPARSFESIGGIGAIPLVLIANPSTPATSVKEVIALAKARPGALSYASFGIGTSSHFAGEAFKSAAGIDLLHVPYKGSAPAMQDLIGGQVPLAFDTNVPTVPMVKAGRVRALAVTTAKRVASLPDVPTLAESGFPGFDLSAWIVLVAPRGLPEPVRATLVKGLADAMATPAMRDELTRAGLEVAHEPPPAYDARVARELPQMRALVHKAGISSE
ncbi:MAG: tripartite tricarboxylate transporter substrate binding protein [Burkholderiales bacterium]|nr:MAG: tripartite tricarboxylate transporter substrate binding protein [Burkholderiales bacterium]